VRVVRGDGRAGSPKHAPFDRIIATASVPAVPGAWRDQLAPDGVLVAPVWLQGSMARQVVAAFRRHGGVLRSEAVVPGGFMGLRAGADGVRHDGRAQVLAGWTVNGTASTATVEGDVVRRMTPAARRRLAAVLSEEPRRSRVRRPTRLSLAHLAAFSPAGLINWSTGGGFYVGIVAPDGRSVAGFGWDCDRHERSITAGTDRAVDALGRLVERAERNWQRGRDAVLFAEGDGELALECRWARA
jgi:hypothetical protein